MEGGLRTTGIVKLTQADYPLISIITVVYNRVNYLEQAILSVLNQSYNNIEYILIDGGSTDGTLDIIKKYNDRIDYWISEQDQGMYYALNRGIVLARGDIIGICHSDDYYYSTDIIQHLVNIDQVVHANAYHGDAIQLYESKDVVKSIKVSSKADMILETHNSIIHPTTFITKATFTKFGLYSTRYKSASDYEMMIRLAKSGCKYHNLEKIVTVIRILDKDRVSHNCYSHLEAYSIHKNHKTGFHNQYVASYFYCCIRRILKNALYFFKLK